MKKDLGKGLFFGRNKSGSESRAGTLSRYSSGYFKKRIVALLIELKLFTCLYCLCICSTAKDQYAAKQEIRACVELVHRVRLRFRFRLRG